MIQKATLIILILLTINVGAQSVNDNLANAIVIGVTPFSHTISEAERESNSVEANEVLHFATDNLTWWYSYTATINGTLSIISGGATAGLNCDTRQGVYTGVSHPLTQIISTDNDNFPTYGEDFNIAVTAGTNYLIQLATITPHFANDAGAVCTINVSFIPPEADLSITKSDGVVSAIPGNSLTYTIVASNAGPDNEPSATVTDTFPASLSCTYTSVAAGGATGNTSASGNLAETLAMPSGSSVTYTATCAIDSAATGTLSNTATIAASVSDPALGNNSATDGDTVLVAEADLSITMTDSPDPVIAGNNLTYTVTVNNAGPSDASNVSVTDTLPAGVALVSTSGCAEDPAGVPSCSLGTITSGSSAQFTITVAVDASTLGTITNSASVSSSTTDNNSANDTVMESTTVNAEADLSITKTDGVTSATPGNSVTYTIVASNAGPSNAPGVSIVDNFAANLTCTYTSVGMGTMGNTLSGSGSINDTLGMPAGSSVTYTATCNIDSSATGTLSNTATISSAVTDPSPGNNSATDNDTVLVPEADLTITKTDGVTSAVPGTSLTYTIVASNIGPSDDPAATVADIFPAGLSCTYTSVAAGGATGNISGSGNLADTLSMPSGSSVTYTATCAIDSAATGTLLNTATISSSVTDPTPGNNSATDNDTVLVPEADLSVSKTDGVISAIPGTSLTYTIVSSNAGPSDDPSATIADTFPADLSCTYTSVAAGGAIGNTSGSGDLAETLSMPSGSSVTYTANCAIDSAATGTLSNTATITASVTDPAAGNNSATDGDTVLVPDADLSIILTSPTANIATPGTFTYVIDVSNAGPSDATNVIVTDILDVGFLSVETIGCAEDPNGYQDCNLGSLAPGGMASYSISFLLGSIDGMITNTVSVTSDASDSVVVNNSTSSVITGTIRIIPTINQWGLLILLLSVISLGALYTLRNKPY